jgi:hypothetical protein
VSEAGFFRVNEEVDRLIFLPSAADKP